MGRIKVLVVDDHELLRDMLSGRLGEEPGVEVVAQVAEADAAVSAVRDDAPDVVVMDIDMPGLLSFEAAERIRSISPRVRVLFLSAFSHDRYVDRALAAGAMGYVTKDQPVEHIIAAVRDVARGISSFSPAIQARIVLDGGRPRLARTATSRVSRLTRREIEVLCYLARGLAKKEIAGHMSISVKTVGRHTQNLMAKLDIHDRVELTRFAIREGLVEA